MDDSGLPFCTGALVSSVQVLTAAHCFAPPLDASAQIYFGSGPGKDGDELIAIDDVWIHPDYDPATDVHDLAMVTLTEEPDIDPVTVLEESLSASAAGSQVRVVGFGNNGLLPGPQIKRMGWARLESLDAKILRLEPSPSTPCSGDSGGPVLLDTANGQRLLGVVSRGDPLCASHALATSVDRTQLPFAPMDGPQCSMSGRSTPLSWTGLAAVGGSLLLARRRARADSRWMGYAAPR